MLAVRDTGMSPAPVFRLNVPAPHLVQVVADVDVEYVPGAQAWQPPRTQACPTLQGEVAPITTRSQHSAAELAFVALHCLTTWVGRGVALCCARACSRSRGADRMPAPQ